MPLDVAFHNFIVNNNVLQRPTQEVGVFFRNHRTLYKVALFVNHVFRSIAMAAFSMVLPFPLPVNIAICFTGSLFYRLTVETNCAYKFALPAFFGSLAFPVALTASNSLISGVAFKSLKAFGLAFISLLPLAVYMTYIALTVNYDVDHR